MSEIKIGSKVKLIDGGCHISRDVERAEKLGLTKYSSDIACYGALMCREGEEFRVVADDGAYGIEDNEGEQYIVTSRGVEFVENPEATLADRLELFDRVKVNDFRFIVVTDSGGKLALLGDSSGWVAPEDVSTLAAIEIYERPIYTADLFDFSIIGKLKWQSPKSVRKQELTEKIIALQEQLTEAGEELAALN